MKKICFVITVVLLLIGSFLSIASPLLIAESAPFAAQVKNQRNSLTSVFLLLLKGTLNSSDTPLTHQAAIVGPLSKAGITAYAITNLEAPLETKTLPQSESIKDAGVFELTLKDSTDSAWIVVGASSGEDIDADGDGVVDSHPTLNKGTIHAIAKAGDWRTKHLRISPLTEVAWRYTENLVPDISAEELGIRLADIAHNLIKTDIDGNGVVDWYDVLAFNPADSTHIEKLQIDYQWLTELNDVGQTILMSLMENKTDTFLAQLDKTFSYLMTRFPIPDSRYNSIKVTLSAFGQGSATSSAPVTLLVDSTLTEPVYVDHAFLPKDADSQMVFTASAATDAQILSWSGCDIVSADLSQCTVPLHKSQSVVVNFGRTTTLLKGTIHNLSRTENVLGNNTMTVLIPEDMDDMITEISGAVVDDFVVGDDDGGFLRRITGINQISTNNYQLDTVEADLDEVIAQGTGHLLKRMENSDLEGYVPPSQSGSSARVAKTAFSGLEGVRLMPSSNPGDHTFRLILGDPISKVGDIQAKSLTDSAEVTLVDDGHGGTLTARGEVSFDIDLDTGFDYGAVTALRAFKFIVNLDAEQSISLTASTELASFDRVRKKLGTIQFAPITFFIGPVPVWITPTIDIYLYAEGNVQIAASFGITLQEDIGAGLLYNYNTGFSTHKTFSYDWHPDYPEVNLQASLTGGLEVRSIMKIYDATGPTIPVDGYLKLQGSMGMLPGLDTQGHFCFKGIQMEFLAGYTVSFMWDLSGQSKIGKMLHLGDLENKTKFPIGTRELLLKKWPLFDGCNTVAPPFLTVKGSGIFSTIDIGDPNGQSTNLTISNSGDETLHWNTDFVPQEVTISPSFGELSPGEQSFVQMSVATAGLPGGRYLKKIFFFNEASVGTGLPDDQFGNTFKFIDITVNTIINDVPFIISATSSDVGKVALDWSFSPSGSDPFVGFQIFSTETPTNLASYQLACSTNIYARQAIIHGFVPGKTYSFDMRAYSNDGANPGSFSNKVAVTVAGTQPVVPPGTVISAGQVWMDRNLGASRVAINSTDSGAYGDLYQWGRGADGHEKRNSSTTSMNSTFDAPGHGQFITEADSPSDWRIPQNDNLWQGKSGINNPCPSGFRLPTSTELDTERASWSSNDSTGAFVSPTKIVVAGYRHGSDGVILNEGSHGDYWSSTVNGSDIPRLSFYDSLAYMPLHHGRAFGFSVRCLKD